MLVQRCSLRPGDFIYRVQGTGSCYWTFCGMDLSPSNHMIHWGHNWLMIWHQLMCCYLLCFMIWQSALTYAHTGYSAIFRVLLCAALLYRGPFHSIALYSPQSSINYYDTAKNQERYYRPSNYLFGLVKMLCGDLSPPQSCKKSLSVQCTSFSSSLLLLLMVKVTLKRFFDQFCVVK